MCSLNSRLFCQKGPTCHAYAWPIGPFWQDTLVIISKRICRIYAPEICNGWVQILLNQITFPWQMHQHIWKFIIKFWLFQYILCNCVKLYRGECQQSQVNIVSGIGWVPSGNKLLPEQMLTKSMPLNGVKRLTWVIYEIWIEVEFHLWFFKHWLFLPVTWSLNVNVPCVGRYQACRRPKVSYVEYIYGIYGVELGGREWFQSVCIHHGNHLSLHISGYSVMGLTRWNCMGIKS